MTIKPLFRKSLWVWISILALNVVMWIIAYGIVIALFMMAGIL